MNFAGCYTAIVTPFHDTGEIDFDRLRRNIEAQARGGVSGVVPCGTTGETPTLTDRERERVIAVTIETAKPLGLAVIAGTGTNATAKSIEAQKEAKAAGADAGLCVNPYYNKPNQDGLYRHFMAIADAVELPIMLYNIPGRTGVALAPETVAKLAAHPNIVAIKEATGSLDSASEILRRSGGENNNITLLSGDDSLTLPFASVGGKGVVSVLSNIIPGRVQALCDAFNAGRWDEARRIHFDMLGLSRGLLTLDTNPIPLKAALHILGRDTGVLRLPMSPASDAARTRIAELLSESGLL